MKVTIQSYVTAIVNREVEVPDNITYSELQNVARRKINDPINKNDEIIGYLDGEEIDYDELAEAFEAAKNKLLGVDNNNAEIVLQNLPEEEAMNPDGPWNPKELYPGDDVIIREWDNLLNVGTVVSVQENEPNKYCKGPWQSVIVELTDRHGKTVRSRYASKDIFKNLKDYIIAQKVEEDRRIEEEAKQEYEYLRSRYKAGENHD